MRLPLVASLLFLGFAACSERAPSDLEITYRCSGTGEGISRLYSYTLHADGSVQYSGGQGVKLLGSGSRSLAAEQVRGIQAALEELEFFFFALENGYTHGSDGACSRLEVRCNGRSKAVDFNDGASFEASLTPAERTAADLPPEEFTGRLRDHLRLERFCEFLHAQVRLEDWIGTTEETLANRYWLERDFPDKR